MMCRKLLSLTSLVLVLSLAGCTRAGQQPVAHYEFEGANDFSNTGTSSAITGEPKGDTQIVWDDERGSHVLSLDGDGDYVYCERSWQDIVSTEITVAAWIKTDSLGSSNGIVGLGYAWRLRGGSGGNAAFQVMNTDPVTAATGTWPVNDGTWHHVAGTYDGAEYRLYIDGKTNVSIASSGILKGDATAYYGTIGAHYKRSDGAPKFFFEGLIDDVRIYDRVLSEQEIREFTAIKGQEAAEPSPADGQQMDIVQGVILSWVPGTSAEKHDVYFGDNFDDVSQADATIDPNNVYISRQDPNHYAVGATLDFGKNYYWRIDEVNEAQTPRMLEGGLWNFSTPDYLIVDDFELYNDLNPDDPHSNRIFYEWLDGLDNPAINGSIVGYDNAPFVEQTIVHGGNQSMPLFYDNNSRYSQAERTLSPSQDWTKNGVQALLICFYGDPDNAVEPMYVKLNGSKIIYDGDQASIKQASWHNWYIELTSFGVDLRNVTTIAIGFGDETNLGTGGSGVVYFDDIRLYRLVPEPPVEIWFEAEAADSITAPMKIYDDLLASGGQYIGTDDGSGDETEYPPVYGVASYNFTVPEVTYKILLHVTVIGGADSFWVRVPGAAYDPGTHSSGWIRFNVIDKGENWHWDEVHSNDDANEVVKITLPAGEHTLEIARRDDGTLLDCILITDELNLDQRSLPHVIPQTPAGP